MPDREKRENIIRGFERFVQEYNVEYTDYNEAVLQGVLGQILRNVRKGGEVGMTEQEKREKVIKGLECCIKDGACYYLDKCPYRDEPEGCKYVLNQDALALLKEQEPRVMTMEDLYNNDMGFFEGKDEGRVWPVLIVARAWPNGDGIVAIVQKDTLEIKADCGLMNRTWRIWTSRPTDAQREKEPWNG